MCKPVQRTCNRRLLPKRRRSARTTRRWRATDNAIRFAIASCSAVVLHSFGMARRFTQARIVVPCKLTACLFLLVACTAQASAPSEFNAANNLYDKGDFKAARSSYEALVKSGNLSPNLFFNLGNADYRLGDKGAAFVAYERALALDPSHPEAKANLNFLRQETGAKIPDVPWLGRLLSWPTPSHSAWLAAAAVWVLCFSLAPALFKRRAAWTPAVLSLLVLAWCGAVLGWYQSRGETWITTGTQASARVAPADSSGLAAALPMGSHVRLLLERGPWLYVQLPDQSRGWIAKDAVTPVALGKS